MISKASNRFLLTSLSLICSFQWLIAQQDTIKTDGQGFIELPVQTFNDTKRILLSPAKWKGRDWAWAGGGVAITALSFAVDDEVQEWAQDHQSTTADGIAKYVGQPLGNAYIVVGGSFAVYAIGKIAHNPDVSDPALTAFKATLIAGGAAGFIKLMAHRTRPDEATPADPWDWSGPSFASDNLSFVSAHSTIAFALASSMSTYYSDYKWVGWVSYPLATITALSRVYDNRHWLSDVVGGAVLGIFIGKTVAMPERYKWSIAPNSKGGTSMSFTYSF